MSEYDFKNPFPFSSAESDDFINQKTEDVKGKINKNRSSKTETYSWLLVFVLMISLSALLAYGMIQIQDKDKKIADLKEENSRQVLGTTETVKTEYVSGDNFTIVVEDQKIPTGYEMSHTVEDFPYLEDKTAVVAEYTAEINNAGSLLKTGIEVSMVEFDENLDKIEFNEKILDVLGSDWEITTFDNVIIPKGVKLSKIESKEDINYSYFTTITEENYYLIKLYNRTSDYSEFIEYTRFTDKLLENLYLN